MSVRKDCLTSYNHASSWPFLRSIASSHEVTGQLGAGAMGVVWQARDTKLLRNVALKALRSILPTTPIGSPACSAKRSCLASLNHPNIAHVYGLEPLGAGACIVSGARRYETLADRLKKGRSGGMKRSKSQDRSRKGLPPPTNVESYTAI